MVKEHRMKIQNLYDWGSETFENNSMEAASEFTVLGQENKSNMLERKK